MAQSKHSAHRSHSLDGIKAEAAPHSGSRWGLKCQQGSAIHSSWVTLGKSQALSQPQLPSLYNGTNNSIHLCGALTRENDMWMELGPLSAPVLIVSLLLSLRMGDT